MFNFKQLLIPIITGISLTAANISFADEASDIAMIKNNLSKRPQPINARSVVATPLPGIYEVLINNEIFYVNKEVSYFIAGGNLIEGSTKRNITQERLKVLTSIDFSSLPKADAIKITKGNGTYEFAVFSDPDCPFCKKLEQGLEKFEITDYTAYVYLLPLKELHPDAAEKAQNIWCAKDKKEAWLKWMVKGEAPAKATCENPITNNEKLATKIGVSGTPTIYLTDGTQTQDPKVLVAKIKENQQKTATK